MSFSLPANMPSLSLSIPTERHAVDSVELNEELLHHWIRRLPANNPVEFSARYLDALQRFNANKVPHGERLKLLDMYREPFNKLLFSLDIPKLQQLVRDGDARARLINAMSDVLAELAAGYKIIVVEAGENNDNLRLSPLAQLAIYRAIEQLSFIAVHAYKFYRTLPAKLFRELHQLYLLSDHAGLADQPAFVNKQLQADYSVKRRYCQLLLVSISNPYGLASGDILRCYQLMLQLAAVAEISPLPEHGEPMAGHFYINCLSDRTPTPSILPVMDNDRRPPTLILNTKPILTRIDALFEDARTQGEAHPAANNIRLLKQIVPFLNTSYQRKQPRVPVEGASEVFVSVGIEHMHNTLSQPATPPVSGDPWLSSAWQVLNKNHYGYLLQQRRVRRGHDLKIGDFVGILDPQQQKPRKQLRMASIRWLRTDDFEQTKMGLKFIDGEPMPVSFTATDTPQQEAGILIPESHFGGQPASLITAKGCFERGQPLHIRVGKKRFSFSVIPDKLLEQNHSYERFTFRDAPQ